MLPCRGALRAPTGWPCPGGRDLSAPESRWLWADTASAPGADLRGTNSTLPQQRASRSAVRVPGMPPCTTHHAASRSPRSVGAGPLKRPNALASAARAPFISQPDARRRRPCRLHAVIRTLMLDGPGALGCRRSPAPPLGTRRRASAIDACAARPEPRGAPSGCRWIAGRCAPTWIAVLVVP